MKTILEYIWIGGNYELRSKTRVVDNLLCEPSPCSSTQLHVDSACCGVLTLSDIPNWNYDGSSTVQADGHFSEIMIHPCAIYKCPFRKTPNSYLVMCSTFTPDGEVTQTNNRVQANEKFNKNMQTFIDPS